MTTAQFHWPDGHTGGASPSREMLAVGGWHLRLLVRGSAWVKNPYIKKCFLEPPAPKATRGDVPSQLDWAMGAIHKMAATLGDSPTARVLRGNFSSQRSLPHLAKHFFFGFLFLLRAKKPHTNKNLSGSTLPSRHNAHFASTGLRYRIKVCENS